MSTRPSKTLETFPNPNPERDYVIRFDCPEFTCLCPLTGQPDFATIVIDYVKLTTGEDIFRRERPGDEVGERSANIVKDRAIVMTDNTVTSIDLATGKDVWRVGHSN